MDPCLKKDIFWMAMSYVRKRNTSYQEVAEKYGVSKSTVTKYFSKYLPELYPKLYLRVKEKAAKNVSQNRQRFVQQVAKS